MMAGLTEETEGAIAHGIPGRQSTTRSIERQIWGRDPMDFTVEHDFGLSGVALVAMTGRGCRGQLRGAESGGGRAPGTRAVSQLCREFTSRTLMGCFCINCCSLPGEMTLRPMNRANMLAL